MPSNSQLDTGARLNDGRMMPTVGYGVCNIGDEHVARLVEAAIDAGYRSIDTAMVYENERGVGWGIRNSGLDRDELFVTTKLWTSDHGYDAAFAALDASLEWLGLDAVDLYLVHWPSPIRGEAYVDSWRALVRLAEEGRARSIGVSNFCEEHLARIIDSTGVVPAVNQIELHPWLQQPELRAIHTELGIVSEAWSPLGQGGPLLDDPTLVEIAAQQGATPAQVVLRWHLDLGNVVIPKSATPERIHENIDLGGVALTTADRERIAALDRGEGGRIGPHPRTARF